jgi:ABC-type long-subunit fatty acid transport system fused permease/ATPase subunit
MHVYVHRNISNYLSHFSKQKSTNYSPHNVHNWLVLGTTVYFRHLYFQVSQMDGSVGEWNSYIQQLLQKAVCLYVTISADICKL